MGLPSSHFLRRSRQVKHPDRERRCILALALAASMVAGEVEVDMATEGRRPALDMILDGRWRLIENGGSTGENETVVDN